MFAWLCIDHKILCKPGLVGGIGILLTKLSTVFKQPDDFHSMRQPFNKELLQSSIEDDALVQSHQTSNMKWLVFVIDTFLQYRQGAPNFKECNKYVSVSHVQHLLI